MTEKQHRFAHNYIDKAGNGTQAAIEAGYSPRSAYQSAHLNMKNYEVKQAIAEQSKRIYDETRLKERLTDIIESPDNQTILARAIEIGMRERAMLTDRSINENYNQDIGRDAMSRAAEEALRAMTGLTGDRNGSIHVEDARIGTNAGKVEHDKG